MAGKCLKHLLLFFFLSAAAIVDTAKESVVDTGKTAEYYNKKDYKDLGSIDSGHFGAVSKIEEKKTRKIYALKTVTPGAEGYAHAANEIKALRQFDHENIIKMVASTDITNRRKSNPVYIVLEHMPCDLYRAIKTLPEIKENIREILHQILKGVAHIHSKKLAHGDIKPANILIDLKTMAVKICDFGFCCEGKEEEEILGKTIDGYYIDILSVVSLMVRLYLGESSSCLFYRGMFIDIYDPECFIKTKREGGVLPGSILEGLHGEMEAVVSKNGLDLFLELIASERTGVSTVTTEALEHPFFAEGREQDPLPKTQSDVQELSTREPKRRRLCSR
ncbi:MAG: CMGC protein kinase [Amphiamblys sp. WSBS2006]|nr:MAG: CMGC protein kinase [Amphiamblys sp. WSBS2006]